MDPFRVQPWKVNNISPTKRTKSQHRAQRKHQEFENPERLMRTERELKYSVYRKIWNSIIKFHISSEFILLEALQKEESNIGEIRRKQFSCLFFRQLMPNIQFSPIFHENWFFDYCISFNSTVSVQFRQFFNCSDC